MDITFINQVFKTINKYFSKEQIVHYSGYKNKGTGHVFSLVQKHALSEDVELEKRERFFANWVALFLNGVPSGICTVEEFALFFNEIQPLLKSKNFLIDNRGGYDICYYIETPTEVDRYNESMDSLSENDEIYDRWKKEETESIRAEKLYALDNQDKLVNLYKSIQEYFYLVSIYINKNRLTVTPRDEKSFQESIKSINSDIALLAFKFGSFARIRSSLPIRIPFTSLHSIKSDWSKSVELDQKNTFLEDESIIKNKNKPLNTGTVKDLVTPVEKSIIELLTDESLEEISNDIELREKTFQAEDSKNKIHYDFDNSILYIKKELIEFKVDGNEDRVLKIIFTEANKTHIFKNMINPFNIEDKDNVTSKTISDIIGRIKNKLQKKGIDDFLVCPNKGTVKINEFYEIS